MPNLEYVVRPYQSPDAHGAIIIPSTPSGSRQRATITWGSKDVQAVNSGISINCCSESLSEQSRKSEKMRIFQNDDKNSPNWVDVERPHSLKLNKKDNNQCADDWAQMSSVAAGVQDALAEFADDIGPAPELPGSGCGTTWIFKNTPSGGG